jgi:NADPH:quinone reductase-like Zn-dependent oxidoreductase
MRAVIQERYGPLDEVLEVREVEVPAIADGQVLVRIHAASLHVGDLYGMLGVPYLFRPLYGLRRPKARIPGTDIAGTVEAVGTAVDGVRAGDEILGWCSGALAEHAAVPAGQILAKPARLSFEQAAAVGVSATTALQALRDHGRLRAGQRVLVTGASGGVGTFAVQIAKALGAHVTGVCSTPNVELVRSLGADHVIDYTAEDFTAGAARYDLILDNVGSHSLAATRRALTPGGLLLSNGSQVGGWVGGVGHVVRVMATSLVVRQQGRPFVSLPSRKDLASLAELIEAGALTPVVDRTYPLEETQAAVAHVAGRHARGTVVISMLVGDASAAAVGGTGADATEVTP